MVCIYVKKAQTYHKHIEADDVLLFALSFRIKFYWIISNVWLASGNHHEEPLDIHTNMIKYMNEIQKSNVMEKKRRKENFERNVENLKI